MTKIETTAEIAAASTKTSCEIYIETVKNFRTMTMTETVAEIEETSLKI
jgi:hypothetical protein